MDDLMYSVWVEVEVYSEEHDDHRDILDPYKVYQTSGEGDLLNYLRVNIPMDAQLSRGEFNIDPSQLRAWAEEMFEPEKEDTEDGEEVSDN